MKLTPRNRLCHSTTALTGITAMVIFLALAPVALAQRFAMLATVGPIRYVQGRPIIISEGRVTAGDYANPAWGDYTGDGRSDLLLGSDYGDLVLYEFTSAIMLGPPQVILQNAATLSPVQTTAPTCPRLCDLDGDGKTDMLLGHGESLLIYWGHEDLKRSHKLLAGDGTPLFAKGQATGLAPEVSDLDGDGDLDLLIGDHLGRMWWVENASARKPQFSHAAPLADATGTPITVSARARPAVGDCDGDGLPDLLIGDTTGTLELYRGTTQGLELAEPLPLELPGPTAISPVLADLDKDGSPDLLLGDTDGFVSHYQLPGGAPVSRGYLRATEVPFDLGRYAAVTAADYDGDGQNDVIAGGASGHIWVSFKRGDTYEPPHIITDFEGKLIRAGEASDAEPCAWPRLADVNGDGSADLLVGNIRGTVQVWLNQGGFRYAGYLKLAGQPIRAGGLSAIHITDYDGDGDPDLFVGTASTLSAGVSTGASAYPQFVMPEGALLYFENLVPKGGGMPVFKKGVRLLGFIGEPNQTSPRLHAGLLGLRYLEPVTLNDDTWTFLVGTARGWYHFESTNQRIAYPALLLPATHGTVPRALIPPCYSITATRPPSTSPTDTAFGLLCGTGPYGFCCYYPPSVTQSLFGR
jgi:hypothetical protein